MKVWILVDHYLGVHVYDEDTDPTRIPYVSTELGYLVDSAYAEERDQFLADIKSAKSRGHGEAAIEERFNINLEEVKHA